MPAFLVGHGLIPARCLFSGDSAPPLPHIRAWHEQTQMSVGAPSFVRQNTNKSANRWEFCSIRTLVDSANQGLKNQKNYGILSKIRFWSN